MHLNKMQQLDFKPLAPHYHDQSSFKHKLVHPASLVNANLEQRAIFAHKSSPNQKPVEIELCSNQINSRHDQNEDNGLALSLNFCGKIDINLSQIKTPEPFFMKPRIPKSS